MKDKKPELVRENIEEEVEDKMILIIEEITITEEKDQAVITAIKEEVTITIMLIIIIIVIEIDKIIIQETTDKKEIEVDIEVIKIEDMNQIIIERMKIIIEIIKIMKIEKQTIIEEEEIEKKTINKKKKFERIIKNDIYFFFKHDMKHSKF